jgi:tRNA A37 methylthiotransferase MiaB
VARRIGRKQDTERALNNLAVLREETGVHIHADLVVGLPGETLASFAEGFDRLMGLGLQEIQVGILKRLRGAPIARHDRTWEMVYSESPPYDILQNRLLDFATVQRLKRFAKYFDLISNRGHFSAFQSRVIGKNANFETLFALSDWLYQKSGRTHAISINRLAEWLFEYVTAVRGTPPPLAADALLRDFSRHRGQRLPQAIADFATPDARRIEGGATGHLPPRQKRHLET